jgi:hypothetical protein
MALRLAKVKLTLTRVLAQQVLVVPQLHVRINLLSLSRLQASEK